MTPSWSQTDAFGVTISGGPGSDQASGSPDRPSTRGVGGDVLWEKEPFHILETKVPKSFAEKLVSIPNLDNIGPARYVDNLDELNQVHLGITEYAP